MRSSFCPLPLVFGSATVFLVGAPLLGQAWPEIPILHNPAESCLLVGAVMVVTCEALRLRGSDCPYLEKSALFRIPFYISSTVVLFGVAVLAALARSVLSAATGGLLLLSLASAVWLHVRVDHSASEFGAAPIWLVSVFRLAFLSFLVSTVLLIARAIQGHPAA